MTETSAGEPDGFFRINSILETIIVWVFSFLLICFFYLLIFKFAVNIPLMDDYDAILAFINNFFSSNLPHKVGLLFSQHNEHRILFSKLSGLASYYLTGKINFRFLIIIGDFSLIGVLIVFLKSTVFSKNMAIPLKFIIPAILLLFQPQYYESLFLAMQSLSYILVLFFVFLSLYLLTKRSAKFFIFSLLLAMLATFTNGNGMFIFLAGSFSLVTQKRYKEIIPWISLGILFICLYFFGYEKPAHHPSIIGAIFQPIKTVEYFFYFLGSAAEAGLLPLLTGILFSLYFVYLFKIKYYRRNLVIFSFLAYLFITAAADSLCRSGFGTAMALRSAYTLISVLCLVSFYFSIIEILPLKITRYIFPIFLIGALFFNFRSYYKYYPVLVSRKSELINALIHKDLYVLYPEPERANFIISTAITKGYYSPPDI